MEIITLPNGSCELVIINGEPRADAFKVQRELLENEPKKHTTIKIIMPNGFTYNGEIYHKTRDYVYIYLY